MNICSSAHCNHVVWCHMFAIYFWYFETDYCIGNFKWQISKSTGITVDITCQKIIYFMISRNIVTQFRCYAAQVTYTMKGYLVIAENKICWWYSKALQFCSAHGVHGREHKPYFLPIQNDVTWRNETMWVMHVIMLHFVPYFSWYPLILCLS